MNDIDFGPSLKTLGKADWIAGANAAIRLHGYMEPLGKRHTAGFVDGGSTLLVSFESLQGIQALSSVGHPLGWDMVIGFGWSHLCLMCDSDTWFRDNDVYAYFDHLVDNAFFDDYDRILFYGAGPCGYAAAAFSVTAPGARVLSIQPQATLDPAMTEWDTRFTDMRRVNFTDRYGYAPDMLDAAERAYVLYDPLQTEDAMHAALFARGNVTRLRLRHMGGALQSDLLEMDVLHDLIDMASDGSLDAPKFAQILRARRTYQPYLRRLMARLDAQERDVLTEWLCRNVTRRMNAPRFASRLAALENS